MTGRRRGSHRKLKIHGAEQRPEEIHDLLSQAAADKKHGILSCDEVAFDGRTTALMMEFFRIYNRVWDRMDFEFCDGQYQLAITTALCLECVKRLFVASDEPQESLLETLATVLQINSTMTSLWCLLPVSPTSARHLGDMLSNARTLEKLSLSGSQFVSGSNDDDDDGGSDLATELARGLRENRTLHSLDLSCCVLEDETVGLIVQSLQNHTELESLDISRNRCKSVSMDAVAELLLSENTNLQRLDLREQDLQDDESLDISNLARALGTNVTLRSLKLSHNNLEDDQVLALAHALRQNKTLSALDLQWNKITDEGVRKCYSLLSEMTGLEVLLLGGNSIGSEGLSLLESMPGDDQSVLTIKEEEEEEDGESRDNEDDRHSQS